MRDHAGVMLSLSEALDEIAALPCERTSARVAIANALGQVLAEDLRLDRPQPAFDRATMDGFALVLAEGLTTYQVVGTLLAGQCWEGPALTPGQALRIMTGAPAPAGTTVVPIEATDNWARKGDSGAFTVRPSRQSGPVTITDAACLRPRRNIAWQGEDGPAGHVLLHAGTRLTPSTIAAAAMAGAGTVRVAAAPQVAILTTGDEVGTANQAGIHDSNGPFLSAFLGLCGITARHVHASDDAVELRAKLVGVLDHARLVVTSGGVSAGDKDLIPVLAPSLGFHTVFHHIDMQPGKPVFLASRGDGALLLGLPGNPVSVLTTAHLVLLPLLRHLLGELAPTALSMPLGAPWHHHGRRPLYLPARRSGGNVFPIHWNGSGDLIAAASGDCLIRFAAGEDLAIGQPVPVIPYLGQEQSTTAILPMRS